MEVFLLNEEKNTTETHMDEKIQYAVEFEKCLRTLEAKLHSEEDPELIAKYTLETAAEFYDGDWCGIIEADMEMEAWCPVLWYNCKTQGMTETGFRELEEFTFFERWVKALYACEPVIITDTTAYKESNPGEYELYSRCHADSILAVPFWKNPIGFMIVRNPKRFIQYSSFLQVLAFVVFSSVTEKKLLDRESKSFSPEMIKNDNDVMINLFGNIELITSKGILKEETVNAPVTLRCLVYLLMHKQQTSPAGAIYEAIWEDDDISKAGSKVKSAIFRLNNLFDIISNQKLVVSTAQGYQINPKLNIITDVSRFEDYWQQAQNTVTMQTKIELLKNAVALYKGSVFQSASGEHWLIAHELAYQYKCAGIYNELMKAYFETQNYASVQYYAANALKLDENNVDAYYWKIRALKRKDSMAMVKGELKMAEHILEKNEYAELLRKLDKVKALDEI